MSGIVMDNADDKAHRVVFLAHSLLSGATLGKERPI